MALFQQSVLNKHLNHLDEDKVATAYAKFQENYNPNKIEQIKNLKEEEYQDGFLRDIFVDVFGYTLRPDDNYSLLREFKNQVAELKNQKTTLSLHQQDEWEDYFTTYKTQITQTDKEIDQMVYELYGLTDEEIAIVEGG